MIDNIKNSFLSIVQKSDWMDQETKANAAKKVKNKFYNENKK